jgi:hypothetical protein
MRRTATVVKPLDQCQVLKPVAADPPAPRVTKKPALTSQARSAKKLPTEAADKPVDVPADFLEQQTKGFTKWLNHMLCPQDEVDAEAEAALGSDEAVQAKHAAMAAMAESATRRKAFALMYRSGMDDVLRTVNSVRPPPRSLASIVGLMYCFVMNCCRRSTKATWL